MASVDRFDRTIFFRVLAGSALGVAVGAALLLWVVPAAGANYRPAVWSTLVVPLGCFAGWLLSGSRERAPTAALACFGLYFLSAFAAARLGTLHEGWRYFPTVLVAQGLSAAGLAVVLGRRGRGLPQVERLRDQGDVAGLSQLVPRGPTHQRLEAVRALAAIDGEAVRPALLTALDDDDSQVRREALAALVGLAQVEDRPRLEALLQHDDRRTRRQAREVLRWIEK